MEPAIKTPAQATAKNVRVQIKTGALPGDYANHMQIGFTREEFVLDFFKFFQPHGEMNARVIVSPGHLKRMMSAMKESMEKYEKQFGAIEVAEGLKSEIGFHAGDDHRDNK
ncbi:MAG: hypothetical protein A3F54_03115 [Candidatus Kerfeldbacteria bacterium RIFCSPHIGHO2_12_FULL_48_17]|uniref:DUF3467 domain-containing protein n=1 Tax=Candidatus Kerfeldbacteria bacterium RIFCSPHIGHO2_12_FULL_48_17 TaxID=1798542 RepID=A0A1G2AZM9_9BACT|nr:MAG: hypothetical protein A3F54_03115 [Candidatus Kerfeldbacteria bacterium RIFCSPHIGHO2_12_FULL_48_17]